jgi:ferredoxin-NADP reductase
MLRHHRAVDSDVLLRLLYAARSLDAAIYRDELLRLAADGGIDIRLTLTREQPAGWHGYGRRIDRELLGEVIWPAVERPLVYVCGPTGFVKTAASSLVALGPIGGQLLDLFGVEMTTATAACAACGGTALLAEVEVYLRAPGTVVRCRRCGAVLMVLVTVREVTCVDLRALASLGPAAQR